MKTIRLLLSIMLAAISSLGYAQDPLGTTVVNMSVGETKLKFEGKAEDYIMIDKTNKFVCSGNLEINFAENVSNIGDILVTSYSSTDGWVGSAAVEKGKGYFVYNRRAKKYGRIYVVSTTADSADSDKIVGAQVKYQFPLPKTEVFSTYFMNHKDSYVLINGLKWDMFNITKEGELLSQAEAMEAARKLGRRLPTKEEFEELLAYGRKNGWYSVDNKVARATQQTIYFGHSGYRDYRDESIVGDRIYGYYWTSSQKDENEGWMVYSSSGEPRVHSTNKNFGYSVRCIRL